MTMNALRIFLIIFVSTAIAHAGLTVKVNEPKSTGTKVIVTLTMTNTFKNRIESAKAQLVLTDENGKVVGQNAQWVIGGKKDRPPLAPGTSAEFNFVIQTDRPFKAARVSFIRVLLEGGKAIDVRQNVEIQE
jgi:Protein of unknown function (DUF3426)